MARSHDVGPKAVALIPADDSRQVQAALVRAAGVQMDARVEVGIDLGAKNMLTHLGGIEEAF